MILLKIYNINYSYFKAPKNIHFLNRTIKIVVLKFIKIKLVILYPNFKTLKFIKSYIY